MDHFGTLMFTPRVAAEQAARGSREQYERMLQRPVPDGLGPDEKAFIESRDSFYMASISESGWPYVQHRGGPTGFLKVLGPETIGFADYRGNRQYVSTGNLSGDARVALFLMDYARKARMKIIGHAEVIEAEDAPDLSAQLASKGQGRVERLFTIRVAAFDWNCPQFITPRFTEKEIEAMLGPRMAELQAENADLRARLADYEGGAE